MKRKWRSIERRPHSPTRFVHIALALLKFVRGDFLLRCPWANRPNEIFSPTLPDALEMVGR